MTTRSIPWLRVLIEGVVIVGSILLAFGIDAWWEGRQDRSAEAEYLAAIHDEIERNLVGLDGNINVAEERDAALRRGARLLEQNLHADSAAAFVGSVILGSLRAGPPRVATAIFDELSNTGRIVVIQDLGLRRLILELYAQTEIRFQRMANVSAQIDGRLHALVVRHVPPDAIRRGLAPNDYSVDPAALSGAELADVAERIARDPGLPGEIRAALSEHRDSQITRLRHRERLLEVRDRLDGELP